MVSASISNSGIVLNESISIESVQIQALETYKFDKCMLYQIVGWGSKAERHNHYLQEINMVGNEFVPSGSIVDKVNKIYLSFQGDTIIEQMEIYFYVSLSVNNLLSEICIGRKRLR